MRDVITVTIDQEVLTCKTAALGHIKNAAPKAVMRSLNKALTGQKTD